MTLKDWQARWGDHIPAQALAELLGILSPVMPLPAPKARHSEAAGAAQIRLAAGRAGVPLFRYLMIFACCSIASCGPAKIEYRNVLPTCRPNCALRFPCRIGGLKRWAM